MGRKSGKTAAGASRRIARRRRVDRSADSGDNLHGYDEEAVETEAVTLEPEADGEAAGPDEPIAVALDHAADDPSDQAVAQSRLPGLDDGEAAANAGGALVPYDPLSRYLNELR